MTVTVKPIETIDAYEGENAIEGIRFRPAAAALGVTAWGMNVLELDAGCEGYPEHDHKEDGQEEVYVVLRGSMTLVADKTEHRASAGSLVRVSPEHTRKIVPGDEGVTVLAIGATPGKAYEPPKWA
ncbi:MAG: hypothetical protein AB8I08_19850 [Sandaracinaceae bacterium]